MLLPFKIAIGDDIDEERDQSNTDKEQGALGYDFAHKYDDSRAEKEQSKIHDEGNIYFSVY